MIISDKTIKLWKVSERDKKAEGYNLKEDSGLLRDPSTINTLRVSQINIKARESTVGPNTEKVVLSKNDKNLKICVK